MNGLLANSRVLDSQERLYHVAFSVTCVFPGLICLSSLHEGRQGKKKQNGGDVPGSNWPAHDPSRHLGKKLTGN